MKVTGWTYWHEPSEIKNTHFEDTFNMTNELYTKAMGAVIDELRENGYHFTGNMHQNLDCCVPVVDDKYLFQVSQRTWGDIMSMAYPDEDYSDYYKYGNDYSYVKWAWTIPDNSLVKTPIAKITKCEIF